MTAEVSLVRDQVVERLKSATRVVLTTHITPDADGLGSALALARVLNAMGKRARIINCSSSPKELHFLCRPGEYNVYSRERHDAEILDADAIIATDIGGVMRLGKMEPIVRATKATRIVIDHHVYENDIFDLPYIVIGASSSAELTYDLIRALGAPVTRQVAEPLYCGMIADTGNFAYEATSPRAHRIAAELLEVGVRPQEIWRRMNCHKALLKMRVLGTLLAGLNVLMDGRVIWAKVDLPFLAQHGVEPRDCFEIVNHMCQIDEVEVGLLFLQLGSDKTKVSLRSAGHVDVCGIAAGYGGGGHRYAAGCTVDSVPFEDAIARVNGEVMRLVEHWDLRVENGESVRG